MERLRRGVRVARRQAQLRQLAGQADVPQKVGREVRPVAQASGRVLLADREKGLASRTGTSSSTSSRASVSRGRHAGSATGATGRCPEGRCRRRRQAPTSQTGDRPRAGWPARSRWRPRSTRTRAHAPAIHPAACRRPNTASPEWQARHQRQHLCTARCCCACHLRPHCHESPDTATASASSRDRPEAGAPAADGRAAAAVGIPHHDDRRD